MNIKTYLLASLALIASYYAQSQTLSIDQCYQLAKANYPAIQKLNLIAKSNDYDIRNINKQFLPQVTINGQATYQSEVVDYSALLDGEAMPPGFNPPTLSKDQYKIQAEVSQLIYDGNQAKNEKALVSTSAQLETQNLETNLYTIKSRINNIYFSILLMDAQLKQNELNKQQLITQIEKTATALKNGVAFKSNLNELKASLIQMDMSTTQYKAGKTSYLKMLSLFIGKNIPDSAHLETPESVDMIKQINRPELVSFNLQQNLYDIQKTALKSSYIPKLSAFFQGAYGKPTLNILENRFGPWFITGIRLNWSLSSLYSKSNKESILTMQKQQVAADKQTFLFNTKLQMIEQSQQIKKYKELIEQDLQVIALRSSVTKSAEAQLNNGVITTHEYIQQLNAEHLAIQSKILHQIQLLQAIYQQKFISGN